MPDYKWWLGMVVHAALLAAAWVGVGFAAHAALGWESADVRTIAVFAPLAYGYGRWIEWRRRHEVIVARKVPHV